MHPAAGQLHNPHGAHRVEVHTEGLLQGMAHHNRLATFARQPLAVNESDPRLGSGQRRPRGEQGQQADRNREERPSVHEFVPLRVP